MIYRSQQKFFNKASRTPLRSVRSPRMPRAPKGTTFIRFQHIPRLRSTHARYVLFSFTHSAIHAPAARSSRLRAHVKGSPLGRATAVPDGFRARIRRTASPLTRGRTRSSRFSHGGGAPCRGWSQPTLNNG